MTGKAPDHQQRRGREEVHRSHHFNGEKRGSAQNVVFWSSIQTKGLAHNLMWEKLRANPKNHHIKILENMRYANAAHRLVLFPMATTVSPTTLHIAEDKYL